MKNWKHQLPIILLAVFEILAGVLLFLKPEEFTGAIIIGFGIVLLLFAVLYLIQFFTERSEGRNYPLLIALAVLSAVIGLICLFGSKWIVKLFAIPAILYGIFLVIAGIYKCRTFIALRRIGFPVPVMLIVSGILSVLLGGLLIIHPFESTLVLWRIAGLAWIISGVGDVIYLILEARR